MARSGETGFRISPPGLGTRGFVTLDLMAASVVLFLAATVYEGWIF